MIQTIVLVGLPMMFRKAGIGRYVYELARHLAQGVDKPSVYLSNVGWRLRSLQIPAVDTEPWLDTLAKWNKYFAFAFFSLPRGFRDRVTSYQAVGVKADVYHATNFLGVFPPRIPTVLTIHDLGYHLYPDYAHPGMQRALDRHLKYDSIKAARIIADSHTTKQDAIRILGIQEEKITVVHLAAGDQFRPVLDRGRRHDVRERYSLPDKYILYVGTLEPRKNVPALLDAFTKLTTTTNFSHKLVLVGAWGWKSDSIMAGVSALAATGKAKHLGFVADEDLPAIYSMASVFVFPSHYEGFGIPPLEAMACGVPVVTTNVSSLPEVVGDAAIQVAVGDVDGLAAAIGRVLEDRDTADQMRVAGLERAKGFSWAKTAELTLAELKKVVRPRS